MKFRFCGGLDSPDWILQEVAILSKMSSVRMRLVVRQILQQLLGRGIDYEKIAKLTTSKRMNFTQSDVKAMIAALDFVLRNAAKYNVDEEVFSTELQQLGLPTGNLKMKGPRFLGNDQVKEIDSSRVIAQAYGKNRDTMREYFATQTLRLPHVERVEWRVDYILSSSDILSVKAPSVRLQLHLNKPPQSQRDKTLSFEVNGDKFRLLYNDLLTVKGIMEQTLT